MLEVKLEGNDISRALALVHDRAVKALNVGLKIATREIQNTARSRHKFTTRSGNLERSIQTTSGYLIGSVDLNKRIAPYGNYIHEGTRDHEVKPKDKKALRYVGAGGRFFFSKGHKVSGIKKDPFIVNAFESRRAEIMNIINRQVRTAING